MRNFLYKLKLLILRILCYEKPLRVAFFKYLSLKNAHGQISKVIRFGTNSRIGVASEYNQRLF